jgi:hypothetical protein
MAAVTVACVRVGTKYADYYVTRLARGVARFMPCEHEFVCFGDRPVEGPGDTIAFRQVPDGLPGWWAKLALFAAREPMLYFDLDTVITGDLTRLVEWEGFGILKDAWLPGYGSGIMKLTGGEGAVWEKFRPGIMGMLRGDQDWLNVVLPGQRTFPREWFPLYKADRCFDAPPEGAMAVGFHGFPKVHQISAGWVPAFWRQDQ